MKKLILISLFLITSSIIFSRDFRRDIEVGMFYSSLKPYGEWIYVDNDFLVWKPFGVHRHWKPYFEGRWVWTRYGWYWDSYEPFGWAVYHYGRWIYDDFYGWLWIPDYQWAPAWVEWRYNDYYIGWAPLPPYAEFRIDFGIHFSVSWHSGYHYWNFVSFHNFCSDNVHRHIVVTKDVERFFDKTKYRTNYHLRDREVYNGGIDRNFIERKTRTRIPERSIRIADDRENLTVRNEKEVYVYRPNKTTERITPDEIKRAERNVNIQKDKVVISRQTRNSEDELKPNYESRGVERKYERGNFENPTREDRNIKSETKEEIRILSKDRRTESSRESIKIESKSRSDNRNEENPKIKARIPEENRERGVEKRRNDNRENKEEVRKRR